MTEKEIKIEEIKFIKELNFFRNETEALVRYVYSYGAITDVIVTKESAMKAVNVNPNFWNSVLLSFTDSMFIVLGRIFDTKNLSNEKYTIHTLFKFIDSKREIFSKENFSKRWEISNVNILSYKDKYMESVYQMTTPDWRKLKKLKSSLSKQYEDLYRPIRDGVAHRIYTDNNKLKSVMDKVPVRDMEKFCTKLRNLHEALWQLYYNGRGPITPLRTGKYSSKGFVNKKYKSYDPGPISHQYSQDAKNAIMLLIKGNKCRIKSFK